MEPVQEPPPIPPPVMVVDRLPGREVAREGAAGIPCGRGRAWRRRRAGPAPRRPPASSGRWCRTCAPGCSGMVPHAASNARPTPKLRPRPPLREARSLRRDEVRRRSRGATRCPSLPHRTRRRRARALGSWGAGGWVLLAGSRVSAPAASILPRPGWPSRPARRRAPSAVSRSRRAAGARSASARRLKGPPPPAALAGEHRLRPVAARPASARACASAPWRPPPRDGPATRRRRGRRPPARGRRCRGHGPRRAPTPPPSTRGWAAAPLAATERSARDAIAPSRRGAAARRCLPPPSVRRARAPRPGACHVRAALRAAHPSSRRSDMAGQAKGQPVGSLTDPRASRASEAPRPRAS